MYFPYLLALLITLLGFLNIQLWLSPEGVSAKMALEQRIKDLQAENNQLMARNKVLIADITDLKQGLDSIEERARNDLGMIKQGEVFYLWVDPLND